MKPNISAKVSGLLIVAAVSAAANDWPQWRGPQRNGISQETGLLKEWPKDGPKLHWKVAEPAWVHQLTPEMQRLFAETVARRCHALGWAYPDDQCA